MRVLVIKTSALGDIIHALPVLDHLSRLENGIEIDWVVEEAFADILRFDPRISRLHTVTFRKWKKRLFSMETLREVLHARSMLAERRYDLVIDIQGNIKSGIIALLTGCRERIGFTGGVCQERLNVLFTTRQVPLLPEDVHVTDQYLRIADSPFSSGLRGSEPVPDIFLPDEELAAAGALVEPLRRGVLFLFHTGTTWQTKLWHDTGWLELGHSLLAKYPGSHILFSWGSAPERDAAQRIASGLGERAVVLEKLPIRGVAALLKKVDLVVGGDTGLIHMAAAAGTRTVSYYRASDGVRSGPRGARHRIIQAPMPCTSCFRTRCDKDLECRKSITASMMEEAIERVLA